MKDYIHLGERSEHKQSQLCCVRNLPATYLREQYLNDRARVGRLHPFPWRGEGPWVGVEASPYEGEVGVVGTSKPKAWTSKKGLGLLEPPSRRLGPQRRRGWGCWNIQAEGLAPKEEGRSCWHYQAIGLDLKEEGRGKPKAW